MKIALERGERPRRYSRFQIMLKIKDLRRELDAIVEHRRHMAGYAQSMLDQHQPYTQGPVDMSTTPFKDLANDIFKKNGGGRLWCAACRTPWPCRTISPLRTLVHELRDGPSESGEIPAWLGAIEHEGMIEVRL